MGSTGLVRSTKPFQVIGSTHALNNELRQIEVPSGATIAEALKLALAESQHEWPFDQFIASVNDVRIPREYWHLTRPKPGTVVVFRPVPGNNDTLRPLLILGIAIAALFIAPLIGGVLGTVIAGALTIGGALLVNALIPLRPAQVDKFDLAGRSLPMLAGAQNEARLWDVIPVVLGRHRLAPMYAAKPYTFFSGRKQFMNLLFCVGYGPLQMSSLRIGDTAISKYEEITTETREGRATDAAVTLFPRIANEQQLNVLLLSTDGFVVRTTDDNTSQISIDLLAPSGIFSFNSRTGAYDDRPVTINVQYSVSGANSWVSRPNIVFTRTRDTTRKGDAWLVAAGKYDVRVRKATTDYVGTGTVADSVQWLTLRAFEHGHPITFGKPLALVAIRARASDQFNGIIDTFNVVAESYVTAFDGTTWVANQLSRNCGALYRHVLQGPANARPRTDAQVDFDSIEDWSMDCQDRDFTYNGVISDRRTVREVLSDIAAAGRATVALRNGKWGVSFPRATDTTSWHFTPRNSSGMATTRVYRELPHALRVRFINQDQDWHEDEAVVYNDNPATPGLPYNATNATLFEQVEFPGITRVKNVHRAARYQLAQATLRPETHSLTADVESLRLERGDKVMLSDDVLLIGTGYGRVTIVDGQTVTVDSRVIMELGKSYQIKFTLTDGTFLTRAVLNTANETDLILFDAGDGLTTVPEVGNLFSFGETSRVTADYRILEVRPGGDFSAQFMLVDDAPNIDDEGPIPAYNTNITIPPDPFDMVPQSLTADERFSGSGITAKSTVQITVQIPRVGNIRAFEFQAKDIDAAGDWVPFTVLAAPHLTAERDNLEPGSWQFRARALFTDDPVAAALPSNSSDWVVSEVIQVLGILAVPPDTTNMRISVQGQVLRLQWDAVSATNFAYYRVKYNSTTDGSATWGGSIELLTTVTNHAEVATRSGTYLVKAVTFAGVESANESLAFSDIDASLGVNIVQVITEGTPHSPIFPGTHSFTQVQFGLLLTLDFQSGGGNYTLNQGFYIFGQSIDLGAVYTSRISADVIAAGLSAGDTMDHWTTLAGVVALDTTDPSSWSIEMVYASTNDNPAGSPVVWSDWTPFAITDVTARALKFGIRLNGSPDGLVSPAISALGVTIDMPDRHLGFKDQMSGTAAGGFLVAFDPPFRVLKDVTISNFSLNTTTGERYEFVSKNENGATIRFFNSSGTVISKQFDLHAFGYGQVTP